ncbi:hypothetical protein GCM10007073_17820 [Micrococcus flavus]|nr:hypothetical protein GCM10007073_17820 [Micrococcus flavus]
MPSLKPSSASIRAPSAKVTEDCLDYDGVKTAVTPAIAFSGPELAGAAPWNTDGRAYTLQGGSLARTLGAPSARAPWATTSPRPSRPTRVVDGAPTRDTTGPSDPTPTTTDDVARTSARGWRRPRAPQVMAEGAWGALATL